MKIALGVDGVPASSEHHVVCPSRATVTIDVTWRPPPGVKGGKEPPVCRLSYLTTPGPFSGIPTDSIPLDPKKDQQGTLELFHGSAAVPAPSFLPLRVRVELQPAYGSPHTRIVHIIPSRSARLSAWLVLLSALTILFLTASMVTTLRITSAQTLGGVVTALGTSGVLYLLQTLRTKLPIFGDDDLPLLGVSHILYRSVGACALAFVLLVGLVQQCVVVIHNDTDDDVAFAFEWRGEKDVVAAHSQISLVPPNRAMLVEGLLGSLAEDERNQAVCLFGAESPEHACREPTPELLEDWRLHPFTPTTLTLGCGRRWGRGVSASTVLPHGFEGIEIVGDDVWLAPPPGSHCGRDELATLWFQPREGQAAHHVRYPWSPEQLSKLGMLWIASAEDSSARTWRSTLRNELDAPDEQVKGFRPETRIPLSGIDADRAWPLVGLHDEAERRLLIEIGEPLPLLTDPFTPAARLGCTRAQARNTGLRATRLGYEGRVGWLSGLEVKVTSGLAWTSEWTLTGSASPDVAVPWVCEAFPGQDPRILTHEPFSAQAVELRLSAVVEPSDELPKLVVPAHLMSEHVRIQQARRSEPGQHDPIGSLECTLDVGSDDRIAVGRVVIEDRRGGRLRGFEVRSADGRVVGRWEPSDPIQPSDEAWLCWRDEFAGGDVELTPVGTHGRHDPVIRGRWSVASATIELDPKPRTYCYIGPDGVVHDRKPSGARVTRAVAAKVRRLHEQDPKTRKCDDIDIHTDEGQNQ